MGQDDCSETLAMRPKGQDHDCSSASRPQGLGADEALARRVSGGVTRSDISDQTGQRRQLFGRHREQAFR